MEKNTAQSRKLAAVALSEKIDKALLPQAPKLTLKELVDLYASEQLRTVKQSTYKRNCGACNSIMKILGADTLVENLNQIDKDFLKIEEESMTTAQKNALVTAGKYLNYTAFSYTGLIEQLEYEGYSTEDATFAVDRCGADWNEQAAKCAKKYLDYSSFSRDGLIEQLEYEGFTAEQAEYGVSSAGY